MSQICHNKDYSNSFFLPSNRERTPQFDNRIMARVYVRSITRSTMYQKAAFCKAETGVW